MGQLDLTAFMSRLLRSMASPFSAFLSYVVVITVEISSTVARDGRVRVDAIEHPGDGADGAHDGADQVDLFKPRNVIQGHVVFCCADLPGLNEY